MSVTVGDILKVVATIVWTDGNIMQNVFAASIVGSGGPYDDADIVADAVAWVENMFANVVANLSDECDGSMVQVYIYDSGDDDFDEVGTGVWTFNPTASTDQLPRGSAGLMTVRTTDPDVQGKKYLGGITESYIEDGLYSVGMLTNLLAFAADWDADFAGGTSGADWQPGVWSPTETAIFDTNGQVGASTIPAYQRRRKRGVGA